jgi:hypothetical protein
MTRLKDVDGAAEEAKQCLEDGINDALSVHI